jgi:alanine racemase
VSGTGAAGRAAAARLEKTVDGSAIRHNVEVLRKAGGGRRIMAVVKGDAYGLGARAISRVLLAAGADSLAVDTVAEGIELRECGVAGPVIVMDADVGENAAACVSHSLTPTVASLAQIRRHAAAARGHRTAVWLRTNIGFNRFGPRDEEGFDAVLAGLAAASSTLRAVGIFAHLSSAAADSAETAAQARLFRNRTEKARQVFGASCHTSLAATHGLIHAEALTGTDWIRPGLGLYGLVEPGSRHLPGWPQSGLDDLRPAISVRARVLDVVTALDGVGDGVGYDRMVRLSPGTRLASVAIGFARGLARAGSRFTGMLHGIRCPAVGRPGMDCTTFDVTAVPMASPGDWMTFIDEPSPGAYHLVKSAAETAAELGLSMYELLATFRMPVRLTDSATAEPIAGHTPEPTAEKWSTRA